MFLPDLWHQDQDGLTGFDQLERDLLLVLQRIVELRMDEVPDRDPESAPDPDDRDAEIGGHRGAATSSSGHDQSRLHTTLVFLGSKSTCTC